MKHEESGITPLSFFSFILFFYFRFRSTFFRDFFLSWGDVWFERVSVK